MIVQSSCIPSVSGKEFMISNELLNKYNVLQLLHHGIGGGVWLAEHKALGGKRVIKVIEKSHPQYEELAREAKMLQQCQHPSIPIIYDILEFDTQTYIVEEFIQGENLKQYIARQRSLSASLLLEISIQLCDILIFLHNPVRQILHLDIKPENLLFSNHKLKLIDFGSAICQGKQSQERCIFGTPAYCAPEMKNKGRLTEKTDIYCMGKCMEYLLLHTPKAPKGYQNIIERCLRKNSEEYQSAEQVRRDIEKLRRRRIKEKDIEQWYAVTGPLSEYDSCMTAVQLAMYLRDRYKKPVLCLDCTVERLMERMEQSENHQIKAGENKSFVFERNQITVAKRVAPQEISGWRGRGYACVVVCFGKLSPLVAGGPYRLCLCTGAITEFSLEQWKKVLLPLGRTEKTAVALTGGNLFLAKKEFGKVGRICRLPEYFEAFEQSKSFKRQMKHLLGKM